ncbi:MAG TPA: hypothetical protein VFT20_06420 [Candidatus Limnocylindrales bacterium]|nr:hypothetical protein [Candidatus Limnocylindrales bacterium]
MINRFRGLTLAVIALVASLAACNTATTSGSPAASAAAPTQAPPSAASQAPSASADALPSFDLGSFAIPSFGGADDLEAMLPSEICGATTQKFSMSGEDFEAFADDAEFSATLEGLGKTAADVSFAISAPTTGDLDCGAGVFRISGADTARLQEAYLAASENEGGTYTAATIGGKNVFIITATGETGKQYVYFKGDAVLFAQAPDDATAGEILALLP